MKTRPFVNFRLNLNLTKVSARNCKPTQVHVRPGQTKSQGDPSVQLASTCDSVWPGLKRVLFSKGLCRRRNHSDIEEVIAAIERELDGSGSLIGYHQMHQRLRVDYGLVVSSETVRHALKLLDPDQ